MTKPDLSRLFRSEGEFKVLASLVLLKDVWQTQSNLVTNTGLPQATVSRVVRELSREGVVETRDMYVDRLEYRMDGTSPLFHELTALVEWEAARRKQTRKPVLEPGPVKLYVNQWARDRLVRAAVEELSMSQEEAEAWANQNLMVYPQLPR